MIERETYSLLERRDLLVGESVGLGNDGDQVDLGVQPLHDLNVQRLEGVTGWLNEKDTRMDPVVNDIHTVDLVLSIEIGVKTLLDVVHNRPPGLVVVHEVTETGRVNHCQAKTNTGLLDVCADRLDGNGLGNDVEARALALLRRVQRGVEQSIDEGRLSKPRFT